MKQWKAFWAKPSHVAYLFVMPVVLLLLIFRLIPTVAAFVCSFFDMDMFLVGKGFVGFQNYIEAFADKRLWNSLWVTIRFIDRSNGSDGGRTGVGGTYKKYCAQ